MTTLLKVIPIILQIEEKLVRIFNNVAAIQGQYNPQLRTAALVMSRQMKVHADFYSGIQENTDPESMLADDSVINFVSETLTAFRDSIQQEEIKDLESLYSFVLYMQQSSVDMIDQFLKEAIPDNAKVILTSFARNQDKNMATLKTYVEEKVAAEVWKQ